LSLLSNKERATRGDLVMKYIKLALITFTTSLAAAVVMYYLFPNTHPYFVNEDSIIENLAAFLFLLTGLIALVLTFRKQGFQKKGLILLSITGYIGFLDEIGFGQRIFNFQVPVIAGKKIDAVHDIPVAIMKLFLHFAKDNLLSAIILTGIGVGSVLFLIYFYRKVILNNAYTMLKYPPFILILFFVVLIGSAMVLDTDLFELELSVVIEEMFETNAAFILLLSAINLYVEPYKSY
jgi:hypothetical protein